MRIARPTLHTETLALLCALYVLLGLNLPFWRAALAGRDWSAAGNWGFALALFVALAALHVAAVCLFATRRTVRPLLSLLVVAGAAVSFYTERYSVFMDRHMLDNVLATNLGEAGELLGADLVVHLVLFGVLPALLLWWPRLAPRPFMRAALVRAGWVAGCSVLAVAALLPVFADFASLMRNHREVRHLLAPGNLVAASAGHFFAGRGDSAGPLKVVGQDARQAAAPGGQKPALFVLVVGETARARNFSLNGYARPTNPQLATRDVISFGDVTACGTSTEVSLPCMFSVFGRRNYDERQIRTHESLLHVLDHAGVQVLWRDNQSGCKGVCAGLPAEQLDHAGVEGLCAEGRCFDEILVHGLDRVAKDAHGNLFVVLHQLGSHGPSYFRRYPAAFKRFTPACEQDELRRCSEQEIVNAYDNSLLYTDHFLARVIDFLKTQQGRYDTAMLYLGDHGESLGESGLYLHGVPFPIAPRVQTHVPLIAWLSPAFAQRTAVDLGCLRGRSSQPLSHDNLFHSVLGMMDVETGAYDPGEDLFLPCRRTKPRIAP